MYLSHFGLDEPPFRITPHIDFFFAGANRGATLEALLYAISHDEGIVKVSGEVGSGKTMLCRVLMERLPEHVDTILLSNPSLSREEILYAIADELKIKLVDERQTILLRVLQEHLIRLYGENRRVVVLIDEAHAMPQETLEQIRLLSNLESSRSKLLQIVLFGQPELDEHLSMPHMRQLKERITHSFRLEPLVRSDIEEYLEFRMRAAGYRGPSVFSAPAVRQIVKASEGLTRRVNILADKSLLAAFADNTHSITARHAVRAARDSEFYRKASSKSKIGLAAGGLVAGLALGLGAHFLLLPEPSPELAVRPAAIVAAPVQPAPAAPAVSLPAAPVTASATPVLPATDAPAQAALAAPVSSSVPGAVGSPAATPATPQAVSASSAPQQPDAQPSATQAAAVARTGAAPAGAAPLVAAAPAPAATTIKPVVAAAAPAQPIQPGNASPPGALKETARDDLVMPASTGAKPGSKNYVPPAPPTGRLTRQRFAATQEWLKSAPGDHYSIQLITNSTRDIKRVEELLARASGRQLDLADFHLYGVKINDQQHYRVAYGLYTTLAEANQAIKALPQAYKQLGPYHRTVERMRSQNRQ